MSINEEVYPNQPLVEVVFEVRFPGELQIECDKYKFWNDIRDEYPNILVPHANPDKALALVPYKFRNNAGDLTVMLALNSFSISTTNYQGFAHFREEIIRIYNIFVKHFTLSKINRVGWRYINIIPFTRDEGTIPLDKFLTLGFKVPKSIPERFNTLSLKFESRSNNDASIITRLETIIKEDSPSSCEALLLDFDYGKTSTDEHTLCLDHIDTYLDEAHENTRLLFEDFITNDYRQYLRGDVI